MNNNISSLTSTLEQAAEVPWQVHFLPLMREIEAKTPHLPRIGTAIRANQETVQLGQVPSLAFAPREIAELKKINDQYQINLFSLGMLGPQGPLPLHYTEIVKGRLDNYHDDTLYHFLNLFHHRALSLHYRAWSTSQATAGLDRPDDEQFARYIWSLCGHFAQHHDDLPSHAYLSHAPHLVQHHQHKEALTKAISHYFDVPVQLHQYQFHWVSLAVADQTCLGKSNTSHQLGVNAVIGSAVPDVQQRFCLEIGPLPLTQYLTFLPNGANIAALNKLIQSFIGQDYNWDIALTIRPNTIPSAQLGHTVQLGHTAWINPAYEQNTLSVAGIRYSLLSDDIAESLALS